MKTIRILLLSCILILSSCTDPSTTSSGVSTTPSNGGLSLSFDKSQTPEGVAFIRAMLRRGSDSLVKSITVADSLSAEMTFTGVPVGTWRLTIDATNVNSEVLYTGSTNITIQSNVTTSVNLVLEPVPSGTGSVKIFITWGTIPSILFKDYEANPIVKFHYQDSLQYQISQPIVVHHGGYYRMWYMILGTKFSIGHTLSTDGIQWHQQGETAVIKGDPNDLYESNGVWPGPVLVEDGSYRMYYNTVSGNIVSLAVSQDGKNWEKSKKNVFGPSNNEYGVGATGIVKINGLYHLYYHYVSASTGLRCIGLATSTDGATFTRYHANPVLAKSYEWESGGIYYPSVVSDNGQYTMVYQSLNSSWPKEAIGYATSPDGKVWTKKNARPVFTLDQTANLWAGVNIGYPSAVNVNGDFRIYYYGYNPNNAVQRQIGFTVRK